jgi:hypothetical protein
MIDWLFKNEIIGHRIVTLHAKYVARADDLNHTQTYLTLETGLRFFLPLGFTKFFRGAVDLTGYVEGDKTLPILNSPIKAVHLRIDLDGDASDEVIIELESGLCIYDRFMAPKGIPTGLSWMPRTDIYWPDYCDYWEWHDNHPQDASHASIC